MNTRSLTLRIIQLEQRGYARLSSWRDQIFHPIVRLFSSLGLTPFILSILGVIGMAVFAITASSNIHLAFWIGLVSLSLDWIDGPLARHQGTGSDQGKFIDIVCDTIVFFLFLAGLMSSGVLSWQYGLALGGGLLLARVIAIIKNSRYIPSDWYFRATAGILTAVVVGLCYTGYAIFYATQANFMSNIASIGLGILVIDIGFSLHGLLNK